MPVWPKQRLRRPFPIPPTLEYYSEKAYCPKKEMQKAYPSPSQYSSVNKALFIYTKSYFGGNQHENQTHHGAGLYAC